MPGFSKKILDEIRGVKPKKFNPLKQLKDVTIEQLDAYWEKVKTPEYYDVEYNLKNRSPLAEIIDRWEGAETNMQWEQLGLYAKKGIIYMRK